MLKRIIQRWRQFWLWRGGHDLWGRWASRLGSLGAGSHRQLHPLVWVAPPRGFIAPSARIVGVNLRMGSRVFIGERVVIANWESSGNGHRLGTPGGDKPIVSLADSVQINRETTIELFDGGSVRIGVQVGIQMRCHFEAAQHSITIGNHAMLAPYCVLQSGERCAGRTAEARDQEWESKGPIVVGDDAWLGVGVKVMSGVTIGQGAVVAAGSVVTSDIPAGAVAAGNPARIIRLREEPAVDEITRTGAESAESMKLPAANNEVRTPS